MPSFCNRLGGVTNYSLNSEEYIKIMTVITKSRFGNAANSFLRREEFLISRARKDRSQFHLLETEEHLFICFGFSSSNREILSVLWIFQIMLHCPRQVDQYVLLNIWTSDISQRSLFVLRASAVRLYTVFRGFLVIFALEMVLMTMGINYTSPVQVQKRMPLGELSLVSSFLQFAPLLWEGRLRKEKCVHCR